MPITSGEVFRCQEDISEEALTARMRRLLEPFLLRRLKEQVASQLVPKQQEVRAQKKNKKTC
jgi:SNF2 family DNA or RNA helicase